MKVKTLRKKETKEFVEILNIGSKNMIFVSELPKLLPNSATIEDINEFYCKPSNINVDELELVDLEIKETSLSQIREIVSKQL